MKTSLPATKIKYLKANKLCKLIYCTTCKVKTIHVRKTVKSWWMCPECNTMIVGTIRLSE